MIRLRIKPSKLALLLLCAWHVHALGEGLRVEPNLSSTLIWTNNSNIGISSVKQDDIILDVKPTLHVLLGDPQFRIKGDVGLTSTNYANGTQPNRTAPLADLGLNSVLVDRLLFLDAGLRTAESNQNGVGMLPNGISTAFSYTSTQFSISPFLERELSPSLKLLVRSDSTWTTNTGARGSVNDGYFGKQQGKLLLKPAPVGIEVSADHTVTDYRNAGERLTRDTGRLALTAALDAQLQVAALVGAERSDFGSTSNESATSRGARLAWRPNERTMLETTVERRFFGNSWDASFTHRSPFVAWNIGSSRQLSTYAERLFSAPPGSNISSLLDSALTTRFPNPIERDRAVRDFLMQRGLPDSSATTFNVFTNRIDLVNTAYGSIAFIGVRNAATLTLSRSRTTGVPGHNDTAVSLFPTDLSQRVGGANWSYRLTPLSSVLVSATLADAVGLGQNSGLHSHQQTYRVQYDLALAPHSSGLIGVRRGSYDSTTGAGSSELALYAGMNHRF